MLPYGRRTESHLPPYKRRHPGSLTWGGNGERDMHTLSSYHGHGMRHWPHTDYLSQDTSPGCQVTGSPWSPWKSGDCPKDSERWAARPSGITGVSVQHLTSVTEPEVGLISLFRPWAAKMFFLTGCQSSSLSLRITDSLTNQKPQIKPLNFLQLCIDGRPHCCYEASPFLRKVGLPHPCLPLKPDSMGHACCSSQQLSHPGQCSEPSRACISSYAKWRWCLPHSCAWWED